MTARKTNMAVSARQRLLNRAREKREDFGLLHTRFGTVPGTALEWFFGGQW
ncbi:MAG: hypothetical protein ACSLFH_11245 [Desulfuromonadales bacterium]